MNVVFIGGGSFRTLPIVRGVLQHPKVMNGGEIRLVDFNLARVETVGRLIMRTPEFAAAGCKVTWTDKTEDALPGADLTRVLNDAVLFEDEQLLILNKPSGLAVHGGSGLSVGLIEAMRVIRPQQKFLELVHRLDRETSGVLMLAKRRTALVELHRALRDSEVDKRYVCLLKGQWRGGGRRVDHALRRSSGRNGERMMLVDLAGQNASTAFTPISTGATASLMYARPHTGRTHQIRVHAAAVHMPIAGDDRYGDREFNRALRKNGLGRLFLHARSLKFKHPISAQTLHVQAPLPSDLAGVAQQLGLIDTEARGASSALSKRHDKTAGHSRSTVKPAAEPASENET